MIHRFKVDAHLLEGPKIVRFKLLFCRVRQKVSMLTWPFTAFFKPTNVDNKQHKENDLILVNPPSF